MARTTRRLLFAVVVLVALTAGLGGCVERELQVNSDPQGALVYLNDQEVGRTPLRQDFTWYGTYDVAVRKDGYQTLKTESPVIAPWWQWIPFDFVADILPFRLKDSHALHYTLKPTPETAEDPDRLVQRGQAMRDQLESGEKPLKTPKTRPAATTRAAKSPRTLPTTGPASQSLP
jgi:PEGA domain-containing protein